MFKINTNFIPSSPKTFIVGGTVRDIVRGMPPTDYDIVTFNDPKKLAEAIAAKTRRRIIELGKPGMKIYRIVTSDRTYDIAPANGHSIEEDLKKRDFTINAMAAAADSGRIIDPHNGMADLNSRTIRMISEDNLRSDPIRLLRAYRFAALLNFTISPETTCAVRGAAPLISASAGERIKDELIKLFSSPNSNHYIIMMNETGLLTALFPELTPLKGCSQNAYHQYDAFEHTLKAYGFLEEILHNPDSMAIKIKHLNTFLPDTAHFPLLKYTILLHDIGKPSARSIDAKGRIHFYNHEKISADMATQISRRLRLSNREHRYTDFIIRNHLRPLALFNAYNQNRLSEKATARFFIKCDRMTREILVHTAADLFGKGVNENARAFIEFLNHIIIEYNHRFLPKKSSPPLINGDDLINEFGLTPSSLFSKILQQVEEGRFSETITTRDEALVFVKNFLNPA